MFWYIKKLFFQFSTVVKLTKQKWQNKKLRLEPDFWSKLIEIKNSTYYMFSNHFFYLIENNKRPMEQAKSPAKPGDFRLKPWFLLEVYDIIHKPTSSPLKDPLAKKQIPKETGKGQNIGYSQKMIFHRTQRFCHTILQATLTNGESD